MPLVSWVVLFSVVSVGARLVRVRSRFGGRLSTRRVSTRTRRLRSEGFGPPCRVLLFLLLLLEITRFFLALVFLNTWKSRVSTARNRNTCLLFMRSLLLCHFVKLVKLPGTKLCKLGHKYPEVSVGKGHKIIPLAEWNR